MLKTITFALKAMLSALFILILIVFAMKAPAISECFTDRKVENDTFCEKDDILGWRINLASGEDQPLDALRECITEMKPDLTQSEMVSVLWRAGFVFHETLREKAQISREIPFDEKATAFVMSIPRSKIFNRDRCLYGKLAFHSGYRVEFKPDEQGYQARADRYLAIQDY